MPKLAALLAMLVSPAFATPLAPVRVAGGMLAGKQDGAVTAYLGVPYAAPPVGANRWQAPQPAAGWRGVRSATKYGASCMQSARGPGGPPSPGGAPGGPPGPGMQGPGPRAVEKTSEDCLFLNVWTPDAASSAKRPVLVFFHGGGWNSGSGSGASYAGAPMAAAGIVMVTVNFRLGVFGFLAHQWLLDEDGDTGNYGLMDQVAALQWVKRNIAAFGGDPDEVTIAGQSSGAASVRDLASIPAAAGLFTRGIAESTPFWGGGPIALNEALAKGAAFAKLAGAGSLAQLRAMPAADLQKLVPRGLPRGNIIGFLPVSGDRFFPSDAKERNDLTMLDGSNTHESGMNRAEWTVDDQAGLQQLLQNHFKDFASKFAPFYQPALFGGSINAAARAVLADGPAAEVALVQRARGAGAAPVYTYLWTHAEPGQAGATHGSELSYVYGNLDPTQHPYTPDDFAISKTMNAYWVNFIKTGNPNGAGLVPWPEAHGGQTMELGDHFGPRIYFTPAKLATYKDYAAHGGQFGLP